MSGEKTENGQSQKESSQERQEAKQHADSQEIIESLKALVEQQKTTQETDRRADRLHRKIERLTLRLEGRKFWVEIAGATGVIFAAIVGIWAILSAGGDAGHQLNQTVIAFRIDERPWVQIGRIEAEPAVVEAGYKGPPIWVFRIYLQNAGKTAAYDIVVRATTAYVFNGWNVPALIESSMWDSLSGKARDSKGNLLKPIDPDPVIPKYLAPLSVASAPYVGSGMESVAHPQSPTIKFNGITLDKISVSLLEGRIDYTDIFDVPHWATYCLVVVKGGKTINCVAGNDTDRNY